MKPVLTLLMAVLLASCEHAPGSAKAPAPVAIIPPDHRYELFVHIQHDHPALVEWVGSNLTGGYNFIKNKSLPSTNPVTSP